MAYVTASKLLQKHSTLIETWPVGNGNRPQPLLIVEKRCYFCHQTTLKNSPLSMYDEIYEGKICKNNKTLFLYQTCHSYHYRTCCSRIGHQQDAEQILAG